MSNKNKITPEDKLMKAIFGNKHKTEAELKAEIEKQFVQTNGKDYHLNHDHTMLFIHAMKRQEELKQMVETLSEGKYFPNDNYRKVFRWSLMQAAQWQLEQMKEILRTEYEKGRYDMREQMLSEAVEREVKIDAGGYPYIDATEFYNYDKEEPLAKAGDKVKVIIVKK